MTIQDYIDQGGVIVSILIVMFVIGATLMLWKIIVISYVKLRRRSTCKKCLEALPKNSDITIVELSVGTLMHSLERGLETIKIIATIAPLLGLLGTVIGIYSAFQGISAHGLGDPSYFADGISMAMITTIAGLIVAIPHYIGYNYIVGMMDKLELAFIQDIYREVKSQNA